MSFAANYKPMPGELFFSHLLRFRETTQQCSFNTFFPLASDYSALGLSLHTTECPLLALDELILPEMSHTLSFVGSTTPDCLVQDFLGVTNPALVIHSELFNDRLRLGNILELQPNLGAPDVTTVFGRDPDSRLVSTLHSVKVALFGEMFLTEAHISNDQLTISASSAVFGYQADFTLSAPSNETDWQDLFYTAQGSLLPGKGSFIQNLSTVITNKLVELGESGNARRQVAQMSLDQSSQRFSVIESHYNEAVENVTLAEGVKDAAEAAIQAAQERLTEVEVEFNNSRDELRDIMEMLDEVCTEEPCEDICMSGEVCRECTRPVFIEKTSTCQTMVKTTTVMPVLDYIETISSWRFIRTCRSEPYWSCIFIFCIRRRRTVCNGVCTRYYEVRYHYIPAGVEVYVTESRSCTVRVYEGSVPDTCCETVNCAVFAPDASCVTNNAMCRAQRQDALNDIGDLEAEKRDIFERLVDA